MDSLRSLHQASKDNSFEGRPSVSHRPKSGGLGLAVLSRVSRVDLIHGGARSGAMLWGGAHGRRVASDNVAA
jgi:hypothetical protein